MVIRLLLFCIISLSPLLLTMLILLRHACILTIFVTFYLVNVIRLKELILNI